MAKFSSRFTYCPHCGAKLVEVTDDEGTPRRKCGVCSWIQYRNPTVGVAVILLDGHDRILLGQRRDGRWCIPCGHVEWDESIETAAVREFEEETGLQVALESLFAVKSNFHDLEQQTVGIWFRGRETGGTLQSGGDLNDVKYYFLDDLPELAFPTDCQIIDELQA